MAPELPERPTGPRRRPRPAARRFLALSGAALAILALLHAVTATVGLRSVASAIVVRSGGGVQVTTCRAVAPGIIACEYVEPPDPAHGPKACSRTWSASYAWRPGGWRRFDERLILVALVGRRGASVPPQGFGAIAKTRAGKPEPPRGLGKAATTIAPASGT